eukprot:4934910-Heterocapsa_arctica.AAC.1
MAIARALPDSPVAPKTSQNDFDQTKTRKQTSNPNHRCIDRSGRGRGPTARCGPSRPAARTAGAPARRAAA